MKTPARSRSSRQARTRGPVVLLTDFGDGCFQGVMKGVILSRAPEARIVDLDHHVRPGAVLQAAYVLESALPWFPARSIFCCVVDPGVGTSRRRILVEIPGGPLALGPDNGVLSAAVAAKGAVVREITNAAWFAADDTKTFEGRSRFAPAAAALAAGARPEDAGAGPLRDPVVLDLGRCRLTRTEAAGEVVYVDSFGNLVTSVRAEHLDRLGGRGGLTVSIGSRRAIPLRETYGAAGAGEALAYVGSTGRLEIGVRDGSALREVGGGVGAAVIVRAAKEKRR